MNAPSVKHPFSLILTVWTISRLAIALTLFFASDGEAARSLGVMPHSWSVFTHWDGTFYKKIVAEGYDYSPDLKGGVSVAFFPLFPLLARSLVQIGIPFEIGGTLINNAAFLGAVWVLYAWMRDRYSPTVARWVALVLILCPFSLFGTVTYTEGLFLLLTTATLRAFDQQNYPQTGLWGALATATRPTGIALIPALLLTAWKEKRSLPAAIAAIATAIGILSYSLFCWLRFGNPLAFLQAQVAWRSPSGVAWQGWLKILTQIFLGTVDWHTGTLKTPGHPIALGLGTLAAIVLWRTRKRLHPRLRQAAGFLLVLLGWAIAGDPLINFLMVFGTGYVLWHERRDLGAIVLSYGFCTLGLILVSGSTISLGRIAYGGVAGTIAFGLLLAKSPRWGYFTLTFFALLLISFSARFAQLQWAG